VERRAGSCASVMTCPVDDYALIGDRGTAALVNRDGSIDWLCWPRFDSAACFAALLGSRDNGRWLIGAADPQAHVRRCYRDNTLILETAVETADGAATVVDFMPPRDQASAIVRLVSGKRGRIAMRTELIIRFDYGSLTPWVTRLHDGSLRAIAGPDMVVLRTPAPLRGVDFTTVGDFTISAGETVPFVLSYGPSHLPPPRPIDPAKALAATDAFWSQWIGQAEPAGEWSEAVSRSLITLKALSYQPSGAIAAAPTTSLPEHLGGTRNWDYRYC
jgi:GH15 family glucan-1,4-alpha-glucosidase